jgi:hypothetical protein
MLRVTDGITLARGQPLCSTSANNPSLSPLTYATAQKHRLTLMSELYKD